MHADVVGGDDAAGHEQGGAGLEQLRPGDIPLAQVTGHQHWQQCGEQRHHHRGQHQVRVVMLQGVAAHGGHAGVMHDPHACGDAQGGQGVVADAGLRLAEKTHGGKGGEQHDQQRHAGEEHVVVDFQRGLEGEHADEVHGPHAAGQAAGTEHLPAPAGAGLLGIADAFDDVEGGEAAGAHHQVGEQDQPGIVSCRQGKMAGRVLGKHHVQPFHSAPLSSAEFALVPKPPGDSFGIQYRKTG